MYILILCLAAFAFGYFLGGYSKKEIILPVDKKNFDNKVHIIHKNEFTAYSFERFWSEYARVNNIRKVDKESCKNLWICCNFPDRKKKAILDITKTDKTAFHYLKWKLYEVTTK